MRDLRNLAQTAWVKERLPSGLDCPMDWQVQDVLSRNGDDNVTVIVVQLARLPDLPRTTSSRLRLSPSSP